MPVFSGHKSQVLFSLDDATYNAIPKITEITVNRSRVEIDASNHDSTDWEEKLNGLKSAEIEIGYLLIDVADTVQDAIDTAYEADTEIWLKVRPKTGSGLREYTGKFTVGELSQSGRTADPYSISATFRQRGAFTVGAQA